MELETRWSCKSGAGVCWDLEARAGATEMRAGAGDARRTWEDRAGAGYALWERGCYLRLLHSVHRGVILTLVMAGSSRSGGGRSATA